MEFRKVSSLKGEITVPGDKSISHRSVMFGSLAKGTTEIDGFLNGADCISTIQCFRSMGIDIIQEGNHVIVNGKGLHGLKKPSSILDCGNSGTTTRLISGILSGQEFETTLTGDASIQKRPMKRIIDPLSQMGADIVSIHNNGCAPLKINGKRLHGISYQSPVASAQVKSSILLAGLYADGKTTVTEPYLSRNHSELMLNYFGADIKSDGCSCTLSPVAELFGNHVSVPGDISSAAYFLAAGCIVDHSEILIHNVGINPTRAGILKVLNAMHADITLLNERTLSGEPVADLLVKSSLLKGTEISGKLIPTLIDEIPVIAVMAAFAEGTTVIKDAAELKVKESDRIATVTEGLKNMGADITPTEDGMIIHGGKPLHSAVINSYLDHRIAMSFAVAGLAVDSDSQNSTKILDAECVNISYPGFYQDLQSLAK